MAEVGPSKGSRKRNAETALEDEEDQDDGKLKELFTAFENEETFMKERAKIEAQPRDNDKFGKLSADAQAICIKEIARLFLFKGTKGETINRNLINQVLAKIDPEYKRHTTAILATIQGELAEKLGFDIVNSDSIVGHKNGKSDEFYVVSNLKSPKLMTILNQGNHTEAYSGFMLLVFHAILSQPSWKIKCLDLLTILRNVDPRFPETLGSKRTTITALAIPELKDDFLGLLTRMKKENYLNSEKDEKNPDDIACNIYSFGARFHIEIGKKRLLRSIYALQGQEVDLSALADIEKEDNLGKK